MLERQAQLADFPALPALARRGSTSFTTASIARSRPRPAGLGRRNLPELHRATLTTQSGTKRGHRLAERALVTAETVGSLATLLVRPRFASLEQAWRTVLRKEFHDILPGSGIREVYEDAERELGEAREAGPRPAEPRARGDRSRLGRRETSPRLSSP